MKRLSIILLFIGVATSFAIVLQRSAFQPRLVLSNDTIDFGPLPVGEVRTKSVRLSNIGKGTLRISEVKGNCSCTRVVIDKSNLPPGASATLEISVEGRKDVESSGLVLIKSNDSSSSTRIIQVSFKNNVPFSLVPRRLDFGNISRAELPVTIEAVLRVKDSSMTKSPVVNRSQLVSSDWLAISLLKADDDGDLRIVAALNESAPSGEILVSAYLPHLGAKSEPIEVYAYIGSEACRRISPLSLTLKDHIKSLQLELPFRDSGESWGIEDVQISESLKGVTNETSGADHVVSVSYQKELPVNQTPLGSVQGHLAIAHHFRTAAGAG